MKKTNNKNNMYQEMRKMVEAAMKIIQDEAAVFSKKIKTHYSGTEDDLVTSADIKGQAMYVEAIQKHFPGEGLIGEEDGLNIQPEKGQGYFTIDPLDGTKAFGRMQSTGSGTMIAHVQDGIVDAICIGDINTGEIYGFGPGHEPTRTRFGIDTLMNVDTTSSLKERYVVLRDHTEEFPEIIQKMVRIKNGGLFKDIEIMSGSIGLIAARLWKNEIGMLILKKGFDTPWDNTPIVGMNKALGIVHIKMDEETGEFKVIDARIPKKVMERECFEILIHKDHVEELNNWINANR